MAMCSAEVSIENARKKIGDLANAAHLAGTTTIITRNGRPVARITPLEDTMTTTTTSYGSWQVGSCVRVEDTVAESLGEFAGDYDVDAIASAFRAAINATLPDGVSLHGNEFYGPYYDRPDCNLGEIIESIDLGEIADRHDHTA